ncbi:MAG: DUF421 domain-containing protein [Capsulimonadales bacterium]|nr:DUF421 domain-containing protein [Capsulimonadales bacterium]
MEFFPSPAEWAKIFLPESGIGERILRPTVVYLVLLLALRMSGKREIGQLSPFDFLIVVLIADAVQNGMVGDDTSLLGNLIPALTLIGLSVIFDRITFRSEKAARVVEGQPSLLIYEGRLIEENCRRETVAREELMATLRKHGIASLREVRFAVLETAGNVSVIRSDAPIPGSEDDTVSEMIYEQVRKADLRDRYDPPRGSDKQND